MTSDKTIIAYYSGTGNSLLIARLVHGELKSQGKTSTIININDGNVELKETLNSIIVIFPVHGFTLITPVMRFLYRLKKNDGAKASIFCNSAGLTGSAMLIASYLLKAKGYKIQHATPLVMPSNFFHAHPGLPVNITTQIIERAKENVLKAVQQENACNNFNAKTHIAALLLAPISILYLLFGKIVLAKILYASHECNACGLCAKSCPNNAIAWNENIPFWTSKCISCMRCVSYCPKKAVQISHGLLLFHFIILYFTIKYALLFGGIKCVLYTLIAITASTLSAYPISKFIYYAIRLPLIRQLIEYTSLTKYFNLYHAPDIDISDFKNKD